MGTINSVSCWNSREMAKNHRPSKHVAAAVRRYLVSEARVCLRILLDLSEESSPWCVLHVGVYFFSYTMFLQTCVALVNCTYFSPDLAQRVQRRFHFQQPFPLYSVEHGSNPNNTSGSAMHQSTVQRSRPILQQSVHALRSIPHHRFWPGNLVCSFM